MKTLKGLTDTQKDLMGAIEMLHKIACGDAYAAIEFHERLTRYKTTLLSAQPQLARDPYYGPILTSFPSDLQK